MGLYILLKLYWAFEVHCLRLVVNFTILEDIVLQHSIIGSDAIVKGRYQSYNIGDNTEIDMVW